MALGGVATGIMKGATGGNRSRHGEKRIVIRPATIARPPSRAEKAAARAVLLGDTRLGR